MKVKMSQIDPANTIHIPPVHLSSGSVNGDDDDDDDKCELITHYASEQYLRKWELANDEEDDKKEEKKGASIDGEEDKKSNQTKNSQLINPLDCDGMSLVSYNSVRDGTPSVRPNTIKTSISYFVQPSMAANEDLKLWQGYGGNIYFDAVRCQSICINSARTENTRKTLGTVMRKSKSCVPPYSKEQFHASCVPNGLTEIPDPSIHNLGSLRVRSCKGKKWTKGVCRHASCNPTRQQSGKVCKGFSDKLVSETFEGHKKHGRHNSAPEALFVSGGQVRDSLLDAIDSVRHFNTSAKERNYALNLGNRFPTLISEFSLSSYHGENKSTSALSSNDNPCIMLPVLEKNPAKEDTMNSLSNTRSDAKQASEPRPVFIIPFGAFDDPVDLDSNADGEWKRKQEKLNKSAPTTCRNASNTPRKTESRAKKKSASKSAGSEKNLRPCNGSSNEAGVNKCSGCGHGGNDRLANPSSEVVVFDNEKMHVQSLFTEKTLRDFHFKREISNASLSNYLKAVPTRFPKNGISCASTTPSCVPKLSYTQRSETLPTFYMVNNSLQRVNESRDHRIIGTRGGYFPSTNRSESKVFYAEISASSGEVSCVREAKYRVKKSNSSGQLSRHAVVKASYISPKALSPRSRDKMQRLDRSPMDCGNDLVPLTGRQISRFDGNVSKL